MAFRAAEIWQIARFDFCQFPELVSKYLVNDGRLRYFNFFNFFSGLHCLKSVSIWSYPGSHFPAFWLNTERYSVCLRIQSECGKMRNRITANMDTFYAMLCIMVWNFSQIWGTNYFWFQLHKSTTSLLNIIMTLPKEFRYFWNGVAKSGTLNWMLNNVLTQ